MAENGIRELSANEIDEVGGGMMILWALLPYVGLGFVLGAGLRNINETFLETQSHPKKDKGPGSGWDK